jgi:hypothetical protein
MTTEVFQDGEPVDPDKLRNLQNQINDIKQTSADAYSLSKATANDITVLKVMHVHAGQVKFPNGLKKGGDNKQEIPHQWGANYTAAFITATPRPGPGKAITSWAIGGAFGAEVLQVFAAENYTKPVAFNYISIGEKRITPEG